MEDHNEYVKDMDIFRFYNKSFNYYIASQEKSISMLPSNQKKILYINPKNNQETITTIKHIDNTNCDNLTQHLETKKISHNNSILTLFEIIKCDLSDEEGNELNGTYNSDLIKKLKKKIKMIDSKNKNNSQDKDFEPISEIDNNQYNYVHERELVLFRNVVSGMFLGINRHIKEKVVQGDLSDQSCEFMFYLNSKGCIYDDKKI